MSTPHIELPIRIHRAFTNLRSAIPHVGYNEWVHAACPRAYDDLIAQILTKVLTVYLTRAGTAISRFTPPDPWLSTLNYILGYLYLRGASIFYNNAFFSCRLTAIKSARISLARVLQVPERLSCCLFHQRLYMQPSLSVLSTRLIYNQTINYISQERI